MDTTLGIIAAMFGFMSTLIWYFVKDLKKVVDNNTIVMTLVKDTITRCPRI